MICERTEYHHIMHLCDNGKGVMNARVWIWWVPNVWTISAEPDLGSTFTSLSLFGVRYCPWCSEELPDQPEGTELKHYYVDHRGHKVQRAPKP